MHLLNLKDNLNDRVPQIKISSGYSTTKRIYSPNRFKPLLNRCIWIFARKFYWTQSFMGAFSGHINFGNINLQNQHSKLCFLLGRYSRPDRTELQGIRYSWLVRSNRHWHSCSWFWMNSGNCTQLLRTDDMDSTKWLGKPKDKDRSHYSVRMWHQLSCREFSGDPFSNCWKKLNLIYFQNRS